jgi:hypothetical protein
MDDAVCASIARSLPDFQTLADFLVYDCIDALSQLWMQSTDFKMVNTHDHSVRYMHAEVLLCL